MAGSVQKRGVRGVARVGHRQQRSMRQLSWTEYVEAMWGMPFAAPVCPWVAPARRRGRPGATRHPTRYLLPAGKFAVLPPPPRSVFSQFAFNFISIRVKTDGDLCLLI